MPSWLEIGICLTKIVNKFQFYPRHETRILISVAFSTLENSFNQQRLGAKSIE